MRYLTTTKNLFDKSIFSTVDDVANAALIDVKENGWIIQGNSSSTPGNTSYSNGWFRPGYTRYDIDNIGMLLPKAGKVTVSAYYTVLENNSIMGVNIYLYGASNKADTPLNMLPDVGIKTRLYTTFDINDGEEGIYYPVFTLNSSKILIEDIQVEYGETPTDYVPYGYLPMYKGRYKVSDVCQLLDKSKYLNNDGYINNGNGTITTKSTPENYMRFYDDFDIDGSVPTSKELSIAYRTYGHKVLILDSGNNSPDGGVKWEINSTAANAGATFAGQGEIFTNNKLPLKDITRSYFYIVNPSGYTFTCGPQLFDLTEMFGAGNEPTTVAEFREKFPDDLYPYSPYCWAKMKNLIYKDDIEYIKMK